MKIALGADSFGFELKESVKQYLTTQGYEVLDLGVDTSDSPTPYYQTAGEVAELVASRQVNRGILCCGTGMGMAIIANKFPGVYAAVCENSHAAEKSRSINNSNILTMGGMFTTSNLAQAIVDTWLETKFTEGWDPTIQAWLKDSMKDIAELEVHQFGKVKQIVE